MNGRRAARRYARAVVDVARERGELPAVVEGMCNVESIIRAAPLLRRLMDEEIRGGVLLRSGAVEMIFKPRVPELVWRLIILLERRNRLGLLQAIARETVELDEQMRGVVKAELSTPVQADATLIYAVATIFRPPDASAVRVITRIDRELIGGFTVKVRDIVHDLSLAAQLRQAGRCLAGE